MLEPNGIQEDRDLLCSRPDHSRVGTADRFSAVTRERKKEIVMRRIVLASLLLGLHPSLAIPVLAQTNEACVLRCMDHLPYQTCQARCTKAAPPAEASTPRRAAPPANVPAAAVTSPSPAAAPSAPPSLTQPAPAAAAQQPSALHPGRGTAQPAANQAPLQPTAQPTPQQLLKPPPPRRPVNEACVLRCLDHGRLDRQCQAVCAR